MKELNQSQQIQSFLEALYNRYKGMILCTIRKYIGYSDSCEDVFHEVFICIIKNVDLLIGMPSCKLEAYILLIARGVSIDHLRKTHRLAQVDTAEENILDLFYQQSLNAKSSIDQFSKVELSLMMQKLPIEDQMLLIGKYYLGLSTIELVKIVGGSSTGVRSKLHRAKKRIFEEWSKSGLKMEDFLNG